MYFSSTCCFASAPVQDVRDRLEELFTEFPAPIEELMDHFTEWITALDESIVPSNSDNHASCKILNNEDFRGKRNIPEGAVSMSDYFTGNVLREYRSAFWDSTKKGAAAKMVAEANCLIKKAID